MAESGMDQSTDNKINNSKSDVSTSNQIIIPNDEILTVIVNEGSNNSPSDCQIKLSESMTSDNDANENIFVTRAMNIDQTVACENSKITPRSILANSDADKVKSLLRKKSVSFENDEDVKKFVSGEIIVDKRNPFRFPNVEDNYDSSITKINDLIHMSKASVEENDFISKEEILKQSKYVPVYIRNPDRILTYDKTILEKLTTTTAPVIAKRAPVPIPRKTIREAQKAKERLSHSSNNIKYPDIKEIKVRHKKRTKFRVC